MLLADADGVVVETLAEHPALARYQWLPSVQADLLHKLGRHAAARAAWQRAADLAGNAREKALLQARADALPPQD